jgi:hypothetical protein
MKKTALAIALILALLVSSVIGFWRVISGATFTWNSQTVDTRSGLWCSLALDSNNNPHISYSAVLSYNKRYGDFYLMYASWNGSTWNIQTLGPTEGIDFPLRLDSANNPHIIYRNNSNLMHTKLEGSNWIFQTVDTGNIDWGSIALALDSNGNPHISYCKDTILKYASWTDASWRIETVDSQGSVGFQSSIALDTNDYPQIFYGEEIYVTEAHVRLLNLQYAAWTGSAWDIQTVATNVSQLANIALDSNDCPHICYISADINATLLPENKDYTYYENDILKYVYRDGLVWKTQTVAQGDAPYLAEFGNCYLALDSGNNPHMTFYEEQYPGEDVDNGMKYASWTGLYWHIQDVNSSAIYSDPVALDSKGIPHVSYCTLDPGQTIWQQGDLVYAVPVEPFSTPEPFQTILTIIITVLGVVMATIALAVVILAKLLVYYRKK